MTLNEKQEALTQKFIKEFNELKEDPKPILISYKCGSRFMLDGTEHILASVGIDKYTLISLRNGNRYKNPMVMTRTENRTITLPDIERMGSPDIQHIEN